MTCPCDVLRIFDEVDLEITDSWRNGSKSYPFGILTYLYNNDLAADNLNYFPRTRWQLDLFAKEHDEAIEQAIETALGNRGIFFDKEGQADPADQEFRTIYRFYIRGGIE